MSYQGEKTCPLCAEEMDLTDQQLKPCKCGYEICVWCWHHIMDMAEKDESEGRCPACRSPYDKEKIVGRAGNCGRLVAEINTERKMKSQKSKTNKSSDGRKQLINVRVIRRNLVYIVGLPLDLADEDLLQRKEYFAQYGKVLKVSMSRTSTGVIQQFPNNTCSVYITYSKEEEAIRCIHFVHGFILDGRPLKACFGTTKYCHAWLRSVPCTNTDCLYLHEIGSQDDSFTKDEVISSYTRDRVQQITGATNNMQRRSGNMLPPPSDDIYINRTASNENPPLKNHSYDSANFDRVSPPNSSSGRSTALPAGASWGTRVPNGYPPVANAALSNGPSKHRPDPFSDDLELSPVVARSTQNRIVPAGDEGKKLIMTQDRNVEAKEKMQTMDPLKQHMNTDPRSTVSDYRVTTDMDSSKAGPPAPEYNGEGIRMCDPRIATDQGLSINGNIQSLCSDIKSMSIEMNRGDEQSGIARSNERTQQKYIDQVGELVSEQHDWRFNSRPQVNANSCSEIEDDLQLFNDQRLKDPEVFVPSSYKSKLDDSLHNSNNSKEHLLHYTESYREANFNADPMFGHMNTPEASLPPNFNASIVSNGYREDLVNSSTSLDRAIERPYSIWGEGKNAAADIGESNIISNILSMNFDTWDGPLTSPQSLAKLLGETDTQNGSLKLGSSWKAQNSNESKFSFARHEGSKTQQFDADLSCNIGRMSNNHSFSQDYVENRVRYPNMPGNGNGFSSNGMEEYANFSGNQSVVPSNKFSGSRIQTSAPPGFSGSNRAPPPGFSTHERTDPAFDTFSGGQLQNNSSFSRNSYQTMPTVNNSGNGDVEFIDPAIMMAVDKGRLPSGLNNPALDLRSNFPSHYTTFENDARLQMLMQQSKNAGLNGHWDGRTDVHRFSDIRNGFSSNNDAYGIHPRYIEHAQANNLSQYAQHPLQQSKNAPGLNGHWDGRIDAQGGSNIGIMDILRNERLGYDKLYNGYDGLKYQMPSSADLYNRSFGI